VKLWRTPAAVSLTAVGLPPLLLAAIGLTHPADLNDASAAYWRDVHIVLLPLFPLLALGPWLVARRVQPVLGHVVGVLGYAYATAYTALDVLAGIGAGALQADGRAGEATSVLFSWGSDIAEYGAWAYLAASVLAAAGALRRHPVATAPGALLALVGTALFLLTHIYWPYGVLAMLALAAGWTAVILAMTTEQPSTSTPRFTPTAAPPPPERAP
jgi:hypothetical protein